MAARQARFAERLDLCADARSPALAELGVSEADLDTMLVTAPARYLAGERGE